MICLHTEIFI